MSSRYNNVEPDGYHDNNDEFMDPDAELLSNNIYDDDDEEDDVALLNMKPNSARIRSPVDNSHSKNGDNSNNHFMNKNMHNTNDNHLKPNHDIRASTSSFSSERHVISNGEYDYNDEEDDDFEVHDGNSNPALSPPHHIENLLNEQLRPGSAGNRSLFQRPAIGAPTRPLSARTRQSPPTSSRPSSAGRTASAAATITPQRPTSSSLRNKLQLPPKLSHIPPPERFPISSSRSTTSALKQNSGSPKHRQVVDAYLSSVNKNMKRRKIPQKFYKDPEAMYMDLQQLKQEMSAIRDENTKLKTQVHMAEAKKTKKQKQIEELLRAHSLVETKGSHYESLFKEVNLMKSLKSRVRELEKLLVDKNEEFQKIKLDSRYTRVRELETELKAYYTESRRLQKIVEQFQAQQQLMHGEEEVGKMTQQNLKLRELVVKMKQVQDYFKDQNDKLIAKNNDLQSEINIHNQEKKAGNPLKPQITKLEKELNSLKQEIQSITNSKEESERQKEDFQKQLVLQKQETETMTKDRDSLKKRIEESQQQIKILMNMQQQTETGKENKISELYKKMDEQKESLQKELEKERQDKATASGQVQILQDKINTKEKKISELMIQIDVKSKAVVNLEQNQVQLSQENEKLNKKILEQEQQLKQKDQQKTHDLSNSQLNAVSLKSSQKDTSVQQKQPVHEAPKSSHPQMTHSVPPKQTQKNEPPKMIAPQYQEVSWEQEDDDEEADHHERVEMGGNYDEDETFEVHSDYKVTSSLTAPNGQSSVPLKQNTEKPKEEKPKQESHTTVKEKQKEHQSLGHAAPKQETKVEHKQEISTKKSHEVLKSTFHPEPPKTPAPNHEPTKSSAPSQEPPKVMKKEESKPAVQEPLKTSTQSTHEIPKSSTSSFEKPKSSAPLHPEPPKIKEEPKSPTMLEKIEQKVHQVKESITGSNEKVEKKEEVKQVNKSNDKLHHSEKSKDNSQHNVPTIVAKVEQKQESVAPAKKEEKIQQVEIKAEEKPKEKVKEEKPKQESQPVVKEKPKEHQSLGHAAPKQEKVEQQASVVHHEPIKASASSHAKDSLDDELGIENDDGDDMDGFETFEDEPIKSQYEESSSANKSRPSSAGFSRPSSAKRPPSAKARYRQDNHHETSQPTIGATTSTSQHHRQESSKSLDTDQDLGIAEDFGEDFDNFDDFADDDNQNEAPKTNAPKTTYNEEEEFGVMSHHDSYHGGMDNIGEGEFDDDDETYDIDDTNFGDDFNEEW